MKFRTDFVTNSSSSCFCVTLTLQFDNDKKKTLRLSNVEPEGDEGYFDNCGRSNYGGLGSYDYMQNFARLLSCRDDKEKLFSALQYMCDGKGKKYAYGVWDGDQLTKAEMRINGCASGEYMSYTRVTRLLGIYDRNGEYGSVEEAVDALKKKGYTVYTDNALETIVL